MIYFLLNLYSFYVFCFSLKKVKEAKVDEQFPDEIDTPMDVPARVRFQKYSLFFVNKINCLLAFFVKISGIEKFSNN